jgi:hypothetical protein
VSPCTRDIVFEKILVFDIDGMILLKSLTIHRYCYCVHIIDYMIYRISAFDDNITKLIISDKFLEY